MLDTSAVGKAIGSDAVHPFVGDAVTAYRRTTT